MRPTFIGRAAVVAALIAAPSAAAQTVHTLSPSAYQARPEQTIELRLLAGEAKAAAAQAWRAADVAWFFVRDGAEQRNVERIQPAGNGQTLAVTVKRPGVTIIGLDRRASVEHVRAAELDAFLKAHAVSPTPGGSARRAKADAPLRVKRVESARTMVRVSDGAMEGSGGSAVATSKTGQAVEIRPLFDPTLLAAGSDLPVRVYAGGRAREGVTVRATHIGTGGSHDAVTDREGITALPIDRTGVWRVEFHASDGAGADDAADLVLYSGTMTFEVTREGGAE
ncbi:MAG: DUF4198 domain-containing protein [Phycisphaerae bacterium]|jgi:hypothetical protein